MELNNNKQAINVEDENQFLQTVVVYGKKRVIDKRNHYFVLMHPLKGAFIRGFGPISFTSSSTREKWVECAIVEEDYKLADNYKIELRSIEPNYGKETFDLETFISFVDQDIIVKKEPGMECVEIKWEEPLTNNMNLHHSAYTLKRVYQNANGVKTEK